MARVMCKVWNDNVHPLVETFKGDPIRIEPGTYVEMELFDAHEYKGQYLAAPVDAAGKRSIDPKYFKMVRVERITDEDTLEHSESHICMSCKHKSPSPEELEAHIKVKHADAARIEMPEVDMQLDKKMKKKAS